MTSYQKMDEGQYWEIVENSLAKAYDQTSQEAFLNVYLSQLPSEEIIAFECRHQELLRASHNSDLWCAAAIINNGCSDDGFHYFKAWLISRGKEVFTAALKDPDGTLYRVVDPTVEFYEFEFFNYSAAYAYEAKTGKDIFDVLPENHSALPSIKIKWDLASEDTVKAICPKLFSLYEKLSQQRRLPQPRRRIQPGEFRQRFRR
ncbi:DUF4240 domain-containing protein [Chitinophaga sp. NPDC101104]|uniref:DUF4240 domain-containing protein n=1 Tax=Chitinophaga sp. NPDC101104 TaxID=3390561 RepID=UPI003D066A53